MFTRATSHSWTGAYIGSVGGEKDKVTKICVCDFGLVDIKHSDVFRDGTPTVDKKVVINCVLAKITIDVISN